MTKRRSEKIDRILRVQRQLQTISEWKLAELQRKKSELEQSQSALIETLGDTRNLYGLFVDAAAKRLQNLAGQAAEVEVARVTQREVTLQRAMQVKRTERMAAALSETDRRTTEKNDLLEILDSWMGRETQASGKLRGL
ncbi:hypothetical protein [Microvirga brassicacearum]|uniref:Flagellar FliJ protein n=1 Tax=Microvirga brassicacearum TaxID=2580413 RepID=A0A5N3P3T6_9HYPH|nr:hypothetical protein [Microvirga brassicacearum]KAB0264311.1 hypothetical protein FEZ63_23715 [Microvirga brassicacearum]